MRVAQHVGTSLGPVRSYRPTTPTAIISPFSLLILIDLRTKVDHAMRVIASHLRQEQFQLPLDYLKNGISAKNSTKRLIADQVEIFRTAQETKITYADAFCIIPQMGLASFRGPVSFPLYPIFRETDSCLYVRVNLSHEKPIPVLARLN